MSGKRVGEAFGQPPGPAAKKIPWARYHVFGGKRYERLAGISNGHIPRGRRAYRGGPHYLPVRLRFPPHRPVGLRILTPAGNIARDTEAHDSRLRSRVQIVAVRMAALPGGIVPPIALRLGARAGRVLPLGLAGKPVALAGLGGQPLPRRGRPPGSRPFHDLDARRVPLRDRLPARRAARG